MGELMESGGAPAPAEGPKRVLKKAKPAWTEVELVEYFQDRETEGSPSEGFLAVARSLVSDLHQISSHIQEVYSQPEDALPLPSMTLPIALKPFDGLHVTRQEAEKLYASEVSGATNAFRGQMDFMLRPRIISADPETDSYQFTYYVARYFNPANRLTVHLYLLEGQGKDEAGEFTQLWLKSHIPSEILRKSQLTYRSPEQETFFTTGETESLVLDFYRDTLNLIPTAPIDEEAVVRSWLRRAA